jgi:Rieske Fe-S protein
VSDNEPTRRAFCGAMVAGSLATLLQSCGSGGGGTTGPSNVSALPVLNAASNGSTATLAVEGTALATEGGAALVQSSLGLFLVARTGADTFSAVDSTCTHERCTVTGISGQTYVCPCHGSQYSLTGQVRSGPAPRSLPTHNASFANGVLTLSR